MCVLWMCGEGVYGMSVQCVCVYVECVWCGSVL